MIANAKNYPPLEEKLNVITHGFGFLLSIAALTLMVVFASIKGNAWHIVSSAIYGSSLVLLYLASTLFHSAKKQEIRNRLNVFDHASIFILIAGTYTPFLLVTLNGPWGWSLFGVVWGLAIGGVILKLFFTGKKQILSTIGYVLLGWVIIIAIKPLVNNIALGGLVWLIAGGIAYTGGAVFYLFKKMPFNHAIFHIFVLAGSICHFVAVFWYVLP
ncbi:MAG TPA: hemolysin III family protein [Bacteroidales bacterium]|nr:hemolysin III family protein [Bacteroidales bacterium]HRX97383.1 hemolysin III family protein [Bacteroidales bacterium]